MGARRQTRVGRVHIPRSGGAGEFGTKRQKTSLFLHERENRASRAARVRQRVLAALMILRDVPDHGTEPRERVVLPHPRIRSAAVDVNRGTGSTDKADPNAPPSAPSRGRARSRPLPSGERLHRQASGMLALTFSELSDCEATIGSLQQSFVVHGAHMWRNRVSCTNLSVKVANSVTSKMRDSLLAPSDAQGDQRGTGKLPRVIPAAPTWRRTELAILDSLDEALGITLWLAIRRVRVWSEASVSERGTMAAESLPEITPERVRMKQNATTRLGRARDLAPEISHALDVLEELKVNRAIEPEVVAEACDQISHWAEMRALHEATMQFAEAAAAVEPRSAKRANLAGRACRIASAWSRADIWYQRGLGMARHPRNRIEGFRGHLGAGAVAYLQGRHREARRHFIAGAWQARDMGRLPLAARAQHDLMLIAIEYRDFENAVEHARRALEWYPKHHSRIPYLIHDFAYLLTRIERGFSAAALHLLDRVLAPISAEHERLLVWGTVARAAAGSEDLDRFHLALERVTQLATLFPQPHGPHALYEVAEGARRLRMWDVAERLGKVAQALAQAQGRRDTEADATRLLIDISSRTTAAPPPTLQSHVARELGLLLDIYGIRLARWRVRTEKAAEAFSRSDP